MRFSLAAALAAMMVAAAPALADAPGTGFGHRAAPAYRHDARPAHRWGAAPRRRHYGHPGSFGPAYGALPPFFVGTGDAASHLYGTPVGVTLYREPYIGAGLLYNTPPTLDVPGPGPVLSARY